ncbi:hypothetical protein RND81_02G040500 [Saponaria officinalis]|uniref:Dof zinc finger protein n=1 Tax=Saponaria officinalis TaxID=3572 RepID=A0AAW1MQR1_SAPOF
MQEVAGKLYGDRRLRPHCHHHQSLKCPRCDSLNTKFCYYNNYNLSQPRHFCKNCRRYWTNGGILRNVPVGGGCRKSKRSSKPKPKPAKPPTPPPPPPPSELTNFVNSDTNYSNQQLFDIGDETASFSEFYESGGVLDDWTVRIEDWANHPTVENGDQDLIDLTATVDHHQVYWSQPTSTVEDHTNYWCHTINAHPLFLPLFSYF